jgi:hypothetical protein
MAVLVLIVVGVVIIGVIVMVTVPVQHLEAVATGFFWRRTVRIATAVWLQKTAKRKPARSAGIRNVRLRVNEDPDQQYYTFEKRVWRNPRVATASGDRQADVHDPTYTLLPNEQKRGTTSVYRATFTSLEHTDYTTDVRLRKWKTLQRGKNYRLGRNLFGGIRTVKLAGSSPKPKAKQKAGKPFDADRT